MSDQSHVSGAPWGADSIWLHRLALLTSGMTLVLIFFGGLVTNTGSALAVPDWPTTFGYSMFLYPWSKMVGGIFYEHSHRLVGSVVGLLTLTLALWLWIKEPRRWLRGLGTLARVAVIAQVLLGGLRVVLPSAGVGLAILHGCLGQAFFALTVVLALCTARGWTQAPPKIVASDAGRLRRLSILTAGLMLLQMIFGALLTHAGMVFSAHLLLAALVTIHVFVLAARIRKCHSDQPRLVGPATLLGALVVLQLLLGLGSYVGRFTSIELPYGSLTGLALPIAHRVTGALLLAACLVLTLRAYRLVASPEAAVGRVVAAQGMPA